MLPDIRMPYAPPTTQKKKSWINIENASDDYDFDIDDLATMINP